ncbi:MAG: nucleotidyl transferase AbiEii/AbiGii toxin family protein [Bacteroidota bacterium]
MPDFLHNDPEFKDLLAIVSTGMGIDTAMVEKDYWIMHTLYGLNLLGIEFELKGGTSLSKGFGLIHRLSEDIDIHIKTNYGLATKGKEDKPRVKEARKAFYDKLAQEIKIDGIIKVERDTEFDDIDKYRSGGIRLQYTTYTPALIGLKEGILLEVGFDTVTPNIPIDISSWVLDYAKSFNDSFKYIDNTAPSVLCYHPGYTFVEKLQTIVNKYRKESENTNKPNNLMRQYYDVYCLLNNKNVLDFIGTTEYLAHKKERFQGADKDIPLIEHPALLLTDIEIRKSFKKHYKDSSNLYYKEQPDFEVILSRIKEHIHKF